MACSGSSAFERHQSDSCGACSVLPVIWATLETVQLFLWQIVVIVRLVKGKQRSRMDL